MEIKIEYTIKKGLEIIIKNPIILTPIVINAVLWCAYFYFFIYIQNLEALPIDLLKQFVLYGALLMLVSLFLNLITIKMVYDAIKSKVSLPGAIKVVIKKYVFILLATLLYGILIGIGLAALIIPGIFLSIKFLFFNYLMLLNNEKIINSFKKGWQITKGNWWTIFGLCLVFMLLIILLSRVAFLVSGFSVYTALFIDFIAQLVSFGWLLSALTIIYIQLIDINQQKREITKQEN